MVYIQETLVFLTILISTVFCGIYSVENPDGSITFNSSPDAPGSVNSIMDILTPGLQPETPNVVEEPQNLADPERQFNFEFDKNINIGGGLLAPHLEILELVEVFLKLKGELAARLYDVINDNYDLIRSVYSTVISKIGNLHTFTLFGIRILRKILEFAVSLMAQWQISLPSISVGVGRPASSGAAYGGWEPSVAISGNLFG